MNETESTPATANRNDRPQPPRPAAHRVDCSVCYGDGTDPVDPSQPCGGCAGTGKVPDDRPNLSPSGNPVAAEKVLVAIWGVLAALEELIDDPDVEDDGDWGFKYNAKGFLYAVRSAESWFEGELKHFPAWALRNAAQADADGCTVDAALWRYIAGDRSEEVVTNYNAMMDRLNARRPEPEPVLVEVSA